MNIKSEGIKKNIQSYNIHCNNNETYNKEEIYIYYFLQIIYDY